MKKETNKNIYKKSLNKIFSVNFFKYKNNSNKKANHSIITYKNFNFDKTYYLIISIIIGLGIFGCLMVYSASCYVAKYRYNNEYFYLTKQIIGVLLGIIAMIIFSKINYKKLEKFKWLVVCVSFLLLALVFIPGIGVENYGAKRWLNLGFFTIQPSEFAKFAFVLFSASYLSKNYEQIGNFRKLIPVLILGLSYCALIILEPNMSITMCMGLVMLFMLFVGGAKIKHFIFLGLPAAAVIPVLILIEPYRIQRFMAFLNPWASPQGEGFQLIQSLYSLGNGGLFGVGLFNSRQKYMFLPFSESDFIFSIIGEELGFVGASLLIIVFATLIYMLVKIARNAKDRFGALLVLGVASVISIQVIINLCVVSGMIPPTGLPLPFVSAGSTSLIVFMSAIGVCLNVLRQSKN